LFSVSAWSISDCQSKVFQPVPPEGLDGDHFTAATYEIPIRRESAPFEFRIHNGNNGVKLTDEVS
jgi:hypothetical protein